MIKYLILFLIPFNLYSKNLFVSPSGSGSKNGSDCNNAFSGFGGVAWGSGSLQLGAGDTLWMLGGDYGGQLVYLVGNGTASAYIRIKRCSTNEPACVSSVGWLNSFDSTITFTSAPTDDRSFNYIVQAGTPNGSYIIFDGTYTNGIIMNIDHRHNGGANGNIQGAFVFVYCQITNTQIKNVRITGIPNAPSTAAHAAIGSSIGAQSGNLNRGIIFSNVWFDYVATPMHIGRNNGVTLDKCRFWQNQSYGGEDHGDVIYVHAEGSTANILLTNCIMDSCDSEGFFFKSDGGIVGQSIANVTIVGCSFYNNNGSGAKCISVGAINNNFTNFRFINNTFVNSHNGINVVGEGGVVTGGSTNNLFYNTTSSGFNNDYSWWSDTSAHGEPHGRFGNNIVDPFISLVNTNLHIIATAGAAYPRDGGKNIGTMSDVDGNVRGADGTVDIGAFENTGAAPPDTTPPTISNTNQSNFFPEKVTIAFNTSEGANCGIRYGTTTAYGTTNSDNSLSSVHTFILSNLQDNVIYHYQLFATDVVGNFTNTADLLVKTPQIFTNLDSILAIQGTLTGNYFTNSAGYILGPDSATFSDSGEARYFFQVRTAATYTINLKLQSPGAGTSGNSNSVWIYVSDATNVMQPTDFHIYDITNATVTDFETLTVNWRGSQTFNNPGVVPATFPLLLGRSLLILHNREPMPITNITFVLPASVVPPPNTNNPVIFDITPMNIVLFNVSIVWNTDKASDSILDIGTIAGNYTDHITNSTLTTAHQIDLTNLVQNGFYHYRVSSAVNGTNRTTSSDALLKTAVTRKNSLIFQ